MTVIYLNEIYQIIYYKYILSFKVLYIIGDKNQGLWVVALTVLLEAV